MEIRKCYVNILQTIQTKLKIWSELQSHIKIPLCKAENMQIKKNTMQTKDEIEANIESVSWHIITWIMCFEIITVISIDAQ